MKKITMLMLLATVVGTLSTKNVFGQTDGQIVSKEETLIDAKIKDRKIYFYKQIICDKLLCSDSSMGCVIGRTTIIKPEIFLMDSITYIYRNEFSEKKLMYLYDSSKSFRFSESFFVKHEKPVPKYGFILSFKDYYRFKPVIDKSTKTIVAKKDYDYDVYVNFTMIGFLFWYMAVLLGLVAFRRYRTFDSKEKDLYCLREKQWNGDGFTGFIASNFFNFFACVAFVLGSIYNENIGWGLVAVLPLLLVTIVIFVLRVKRVKRFRIWINERSYFIENLILIFCFLLALIYSGEFSWGNYAGFMFMCISGLFMLLMFIARFRFHKTIHKESLINTIIRNVKNFGIKEVPGSSTKN